MVDDGILHISMMTPDELAKFLKEVVVDARRTAKGLGVDEEIFDDMVQLNRTIDGKGKMRPFIDIMSQKGNDTVVVQLSLARALDNRLITSSDDLTTVLRKNVRHRVRG